MKRIIVLLITFVFVIVGCSSKESDKTGYKEDAGKAHACSEACSDSCIMGHNEVAGKAHVHSAACGNSCTMGKADEHAGEAHVCSEACAKSCTMGHKEDAGKAHVHGAACGDSCTMGQADEHAGKEHGGVGVAQEHGGAAVSQEHGGTEHAGQEHGGQAAQSFSAAEIKAAMNAYISGRETDGVFKIKDEKTGDDLSLTFVKIHDPVRKIEGKGFFACTDFEVVGAAGKLYDLDFWLNPKGGTLVVTEEKIHKHPMAKGTGWEKKARYTFVNDNPVEIK